MIYRVRAFDRIFKRIFFKLCFALLWYSFCCVLEALSANFVARKMIHFNSLPFSRILPKCYRMCIRQNFELKNSAKRSLEKANYHMMLLVVKTLSKLEEIFVSSTRLWEPSQPHLIVKKRNTSWKNHWTAHDENNQSSLAWKIISEISGKKRPNKSKLRANSQQQPFWKNPVLIDAPIKNIINKNLPFKCRNLLESVLKNLKTRKAAGPDTIPPEVWIIGLFQF